jgi:Flp pilus assembly protein TadD
LVQLRGGDTSGAAQTLHAGLSRIPDSGRIAWGQGVLAVMENQCPAAEQHFVRALDMLPDWPSAYSTLAVLYLNTGQVAKARAVFWRYQEVFPQGPLDTQTITRQLAAARENPQPARTLTPQMQAQFLQLAFALTDRNP